MRLRHRSCLISQALTLSLRDFLTPEAKGNQMVDSQVKQSTQKDLGPNHN